MLIKSATKEEVKAKLKGEEARNFIEDIEQLTPKNLKTFISVAFMVMQLKRYSRDELKTIIGYAKTLKRG